jgi:hypothetical protein
MYQVLQFTISTNVYFIEEYLWHGAAAGGESRHFDAYLRGIMIDQHGCVRYSVTGRARAPYNSRGL